MNEYSIYEDIGKRTGGDVTIGVTGPVRTGKSTLIKRFMETLVLPNVTDDGMRERTLDSLPQSASGRTVMTTEPKFIPEEAVGILVGKVALRVRMVDCVGYIVDEALGQLEDGSPRMVQTPWADAPMPFREAAELGTRKVIKEHSTIGLLVSTDGSFGDIPRESYAKAEEEVAAELRAAGRPFAVILNSARPSDPAAVSLALHLENKYGAPVALVNCQQLNAEDIKRILELVLHEFPVRSVSFRTPAWMDVLPPEHPLREALLSAARTVGDAVCKMGDVEKRLPALSFPPEIAGVETVSMGAGDGSVILRILPQSGLFFRTVSDLVGTPVEDEAALLPLLCHLSETSKAYDRVRNALQAAEETGYGIVMPTVDQLKLGEPQIVKQAGGYGVKLHASAQSIHMIHPVVGTETQTQELIQDLLQQFSQDPEKLWESKMFGKSLYELVNEGLHAKLAHMPEESRTRLAQTLERIINEGSGGLICILL